MTRTSRRRRWLRSIAGLAVLGLVAAGCAENKKDAGSGGGGSGGVGDKKVSISGPETGVEADGFTESFKSFSDDTGIEVTYNGSRDFETQIRNTSSDNLPDIGVIPQPGLVKDLADEITAVPKNILDGHKKQYADTLWDLVTVDGKVLGVPNKGDLKSLVWYSPKTFKDNGYEIPKTWDDLMSLADQMKSDGIAPWCVGIESGDATGWPLTDWIEDLMLRVNGPDVYDQWVAHEIPFNDPKVKKVVQMVQDIWFTEGNVLDGRQSIASTGFAAAGLPILDGKCGLHRQGNFFAANFADEGAKFGPDADVDAFYLPTINDDFGKVTLVGGTYVVAFNDDPSTLKALEFLSSPEYVNARIKADKGGFLSANTEHDTSLYSSPIDKKFADILVSADPARFDGADQMPSAVGSGSFWKEGTNWVIGDEDLDTFLNNVEDSWPS
jgi:alpha-glucoside transport system substrate-binding protein